VFEATLLAYRAHKHPHTPTHTNTHTHTHTHLVFETALLAVLAYRGAISRQIFDTVSLFDYFPERL